MTDYATTERLQFISEVFKDEGAVWRLEAKRARARIKLMEIKERHPEWIVKRLTKTTFNVSGEWNKVVTEFEYIVYGGGGWGDDRSDKT